jgi:hypothetical protein
MSFPHPHVSICRSTVAQVLTDKRQRVHLGGIDFFKGCSQSVLDVGATASVWYGGHFINKL